MTSPVRATALVAGLLGTGLAAGLALGSLAAEQVEDPYAPVETLVRVLGIIETRWVDEIDTRELVDGAIAGMVDRLDEHSAWLPAEVWRDLQRETHGSYTGIGVEVRLVPEGARVVRVHPDSPASRDGIAVGDLILSVDGRRLDAAGLQEPGAALLGPRGSEARIELLRPGWDAPRTFVTVRDTVHTPAVAAERLDERVAYVRLGLFQQGAAAELREALDRLAAPPGYAALVLDLRDNPGGLLDEAVAVADLFLDGGVVVSTEGRGGTRKEVHTATPGAVGVPLVVLVNGGSASGSEIVAAALQETGRARLVGTRTYGKGTVQAVFETRDGAALKLTVGRYLTPSGRPVAPKEGRTPDLVVETPEAGTPAARLRAALAVADLPEDQRRELLDLVDALPRAETRAVRKAVDDRPAAERAKDDPQLQAAWTLALGLLADGR